MEFPLHTHTHKPTQRHSATRVIKKKKIHQMHTKSTGSTWRTTHTRAWAHSLVRVKCAMCKWAFFRGYPFYCLRVAITTHTCVFYSCVCCRDCSHRDADTEINTHTYVQLTHAMPRAQNASREQWNRTGLPVWCFRGVGACAHFEKGHWLHRSFVMNIKNTLSVTNHLHFRVHSCMTKL